MTSPLSLTSDHAMGLHVVRFHNVTVYAGEDEHYAARLHRDLVVALDDHDDDVRSELLQTAKQLTASPRRSPT